MIPNMIFQTFTLKKAFQTPLKATKTPLLYFKCHIRHKKKSKTLNLRYLPRKMSFYSIF